MDNTVRTPKQQRGKETKLKIIRAAIKLFAKKGFYKTNSKEIAKRAGIDLDKPERARKVGNEFIGQS